MELLNVGHIYLLDAENFHPKILRKKGFAFFWEYTQGFFFNFVMWPS
jgi:hypothetical protein